MANLDGVLDKITTAMIEAGNSLSGNLVGEGNKIVLALLMCMVAYHLVMSFAGEDWSMTQVNLMQLILKWAIVTFLLAHWGEVGEFFTKGFKHLASTAVGGEKKDNIDLGIQVIKNLFGIGLTDKDGQPCPFLGCRGANAAERNWYDIFGKIKDGVVAALNVALIFFGLIAKLLAAISVMFMIAATALVSLYGHFMVAVGLVVGPIMIPFLLVPSLSSYFNSWLKFMVSGGMIYIVSAVTIVFVGSAFTELNRISGYANDFSDLGVDLMVIFVMIIIAGIGGYLTMKAPEFANSLVRGEQMGDAKGATSSGAKQAASQGANVAKAAA